MRRAALAIALAALAAALGYSALYSTRHEGQGRQSRPMMEAGEGHRGDMERGGMPRGHMEQGQMPHGGGMGDGEMGPSLGEGAEGDPAEGREIYQRLCASCHGATGRGDGPVGRALSPKPSDLTQHVGHHSDGYFFKVIKEGGASVGRSAAMPAWGGQLTDEEIWDVISYIRTLADGN